jgi:hypothetical protein
MSDHSVDRYNYARQLLNNRSNENLLVAYSWLSLASDEIDMKIKAGDLMRQVEYEIKSRNICDKAIEIEATYRSKYSAEALLKKLRTSRNPLKYVLYKVFVLVQKIVKYFEGSSKINIRFEKSSSNYG